MCVLHLVLRTLTIIHTLNPQAKDELCSQIDNYIRDRITFADQVIQETAMKKIHHGDVVLTYARWLHPSFRFLYLISRQVIRRSEGPTRSLG